MKKGKQEKKEKKGNIPNRQVYQRLNYLAQAASYFSTLAADKPLPSSSYEGNSRTLPDTAHPEPIGTAFSESSQNDVNTTSAEPAISPASVVLPNTQKGKKQIANRKLYIAQSRRLVTNLRAISLKAQISLTRRCKYSVCKYCDSPLHPGGTSDVTIENPSKNRRRPELDMLVVTCLSCNNKRRFPVENLPKRKRKEDRDTSVPLKQTNVPTAAET